MLGIKDAQAERRKKRKERRVCGAIVRSVKDGGSTAHMVFVSFATISNGRRESSYAQGVKDGGNTAHTVSARVATTSNVVRRESSYAQDVKDGGNTAHTVSARVATTRNGRR
ncbi:MAG: hypothetical protein OXU73_00515 [Candidatus Campbellbacteria bacterium]|nr:hypothetical protein [Candidatus Campbellbacteria bacterium]